VQRAAGQAPTYRASCPRAAAAVTAADAAAVAAAGGNPAQPGFCDTIKEIIITDSNACFKIVLSPYQSKENLQLDTERLLQLHRTQQAGQQLPMLSSVPARAGSNHSAAASSSSSSSNTYAAIASTSAYRGLVGSSSSSSTAPAAVTSSNAAYTVCLRPRTLAALKLHHLRCTYHCHHHGHNSWQGQQLYHHHQQQQQHNQH
jgi:hypothetical protein